MKSVLRSNTLLVAIAFGLLTLLFYHRIALTDEILVNYDLLTYFYPYKTYVAGTIKQGYLPLWNPYLFMGVPLLANIQTAVFYPPNLLFIWLDAPHAVNGSILLHIFLAGFLMHLLGRHALGLGVRGAFLAGAVFMFSGFLSRQVGHINQLNVSTWLPALVLCYLMAVRKQSWNWVLLGGLVVGLQVTAGHPQALFLSLATLFVFVVFQTGHALQQQRGRNRKESWAALWYALWPFMVLLAMGLGLSLAQLLPTWELSTHSIRAGGMSYEEAVSFSLPPPELLRSLFPPFSDPPLGEYVAYIGVIPLVVGTWALWRFLRHPVVPISLTLVLTGLFLAFGGYNPFYEVLYRVAPGLDLFRVPARWLFLYTFGMSMAAGVGFDCLLGTSAPKLKPSSAAGNGGQSWRSWGLWLAIGALFLLSGGLAVCKGAALLEARGVPWLILPQPLVVAAWVGLGVLAVVLIIKRRYLPKSTLVFVLGLLPVLAELYVGGQALEYKRIVPAQAYTSLRPVITQLLLDQSPYRVLSVASSHFDPGDLRELEQILGQRYSEEAALDYVTALKLREILTPNLPLSYGIGTVDGYDGGVLPLRRYVEFKRFLLDSGGRVDAQTPDHPDALLRTQLLGVPDAALLGALNVKYLIDDKTNDPWLDNVYYDLAFEIEVPKDQPLVLDKLPSFQATALGVTSYLDGAATVADGTPVARVTVGAKEGVPQSYTLLAGRDSSEGRYDEPLESPSHTKGRVAIAWKENPTAYHYHAKVPLSRPITPVEIVVENLLPVGQLHISGMSLFDDRVCGPKCPSESLVVNQDFQLVNSGDLKLYELLTWRPRLYLVHQYMEEIDQMQVLHTLEREMNEVVVLSRIPSELGTSTPEKREDDIVDITHLGPEKVEATVKTASAGILVFSDAYYPGWRAWMDGHETEVLRANHLFKAVAVPAGEHTVRFEYKPRSLLIGAATSAGTAFLMLAIAVYVRFRGRPLPPTLD